MLEPDHDISNSWRNYTLAFSLLFTLVFIFIYSSGVLYKLGEIVNSKTIKFAGIQSEIAEAEVGGDVTVDPPKMEKAPIPELSVQMVDANIFSAEAMIVKDYESGQVLFGKNEYAQRPIASLVKLMSALVLLENSPDWNATTTVVGSNLVDPHLAVGEVYDLETLWKAGLIASSNRAIMSLSNHYHWNREAFVERMNQKALEIGMANTYFYEPTGLDAQNVSTASDLAILLGEAMRKSKIAETLNQEKITVYSKLRGGNYQMRSTNWLLLNWVPHNDLVLYGGKTGYINASGYNFISRFGDGRGHIIDVVILGAQTHEARFTEARDIAQWVFDNYTWP